MGLACPLVVLLIQCRSILCLHLVNAPSLWCFYREPLLLLRFLLVCRMLVGFLPPSIFKWNLPPITKTIQVRWTRHAGHCWRSRDELISDVLLWTPTYGLAKAGRPARTYIQQLCEDSPEDLPEAMNDREKWRERVRDIRAGGMTWWWWWWYGFIFYCNIK